MKPALRITPAIAPSRSRSHPSAVPAAPDSGRESRELWAGVHVPDGKPALLERLAVRAQRFSPRVSLEPPDGLTLEVRGSLHLFGGPHELRRSVEAECEPLASRITVALAPTPLAALASARAGAALIVTDPAHLVGQLAALPLHVLRWREETLDRLVHIGVRTIGQVLRLPRAGFARRFGIAQLETLDRLIGRRTDPRSDFRPRERFRARHEPSYELEHHEAIVAVLASLLGQLEHFLRGRQCGITELAVRLHHRLAPATRCVLSLAAPEADAGRLGALLAEKLSQLVLPEPVRLCELRSGRLVPRAATSHALWQPGEHGGGASAEAPAFLERLRTRLGEDAVYGIAVSAEHRPEVAWRSAEALPDRCRESARRSRATTHEASCTPWPRGRRPLWLLPAPQPLPASDGCPRHHGPLHLLSEPERIETGWWDGRDVARDYYVAEDRCGARLWIYRERAPPHSWYLHGLFA